MFDIKILKATDVNDSHFNGWQLLVENASTRNPVYEKWLLLPALKYLAGDNVYVIFIYDDRQLVCIWPVTYSKKKLRLNTVKSWVHDHGFLGNPIIDKRNESIVLEFLVKESLIFFKADAISFNLYPSYLNKVELNSNKLINIRRNLYSRPYLLNDHSFDDHLTKLSAKSRKNYKRHINRIHEIGYKYRESTKEFPLEYWKDRFLSLEDSGWKGKNKTSIVSNVSVLKYYNEALDYAWKNDQVVFQEFHNEQGTAASAFRWISGLYSYEVKIAYDERLSKLSPGTCLEFKILEGHLASSFIAVDSCTNYENKQLESLWQDRITLNEFIFFEKNIKGYITHKVYSLMISAKKHIKRVANLNK